MDEAVRSGLALVRDGFKTAYANYPGFQCKMYQEHHGHELQRSIYNPHAFRHLHQHHRGRYVYADEDIWRALYFVAPAVDGPSADLRRELLPSFYDNQRRFRTRLLAEPLYDWYKVLASQSARLLKAVEHPICANYSRIAMPVEVWTWALFDWSWGFEHDDIRFIARWSQPDIDCGLAPIRPAQLRELAEKDGRVRYLEFVEQWERNPPLTFICHIDDVFAKSVEFLDWLQNIPDRTRLQPAIPATVPSDILSVQESQWVGNRPAFARDHLWRAWKQNEGLGPAGIRDRWNAMSNAERMEICPDWATTIEAGDKGREVVKSALKIANTERDGTKS